MNNYFCEICNFTTIRKRDFMRHLKSTKHQINSENLNNYEGDPHKSAKCAKNPHKPSLREGKSCVETSQTLTNPHKPSYFDHESCRPFNRELKVFKLIKDKDIYYYAEINGDLKHINPQTEKVKKVERKHIDDKLRDGYQYSNTFSDTEKECIRARSTFVLYHPDFYHNSNKIPKDVTKIFRDGRLYGNWNKIESPNGSKSFNFTKVDLKSKEIVKQLGLTFSKNISRWHKNNLSSSLQKFIESLKSVFNADTSNNSNLKLYNLALKNNIFVPNGSEDQDGKKYVDRRPKSVLASSKYNSFNYNSDSGEVSDVFVDPQIVEDQNCDVLGKNRDVEDHNVDNNQNIGSDDFKYDTNDEADSIINSDYDYDYDYDSESGSGSDSDLQPINSQSDEDDEVDQDEELQNENSNNNIEDNMLNDGNQLNLVNFGSLTDRIGQLFLEIINEHRNLEFNDYNFDNLDESERFSITDLHDTLENIQLLFRESKK